jgi:hypothetical protein
LPTCVWQPPHVRGGRDDYSIRSMELEVGQMETSHFFDIGEDYRRKQQKMKSSTENNRVMMLKYIPKKLQNIE